MLHLQNFLFVHFNLIRFTFSKNRRHDRQYVLAITIAREPEGGRLFNGSKHIAYTKTIFSKRQVKRLFEKHVLNVLT